MVSAYDDLSVGYRYFAGDLVDMPVSKVSLRDAQKAGKIIAKIGAAANALTDPAKGQTATAQDPRQAFAARWSKRVVPAVLKEIMRHADIQTTMTFYVTQSAKVTASELWAAAGNNLGNSDPKKEVHPTGVETICFEPGKHGEF